MAFHSLTELFDSVPDGVSIINRDMRIEWVNRALQNKGFLCENVKGQKCYFAYKKSSSICRNCPTLKVFNTGKTIRIYERGADGKHYEVTAIPVFGENKAEKKVENVVEIVREIKKKTPFAVSLSSISVMAFIADPEGKIVASNKAAESILGYSEKELAGKSFSSIAPKIESEHFMKIFRDVIEGRHFPSFRAEISKKSGGSIHAELSCNPFYSNGSTLGVEVIARDITSQVESENALKESEKRYRDFVKNLKGIAYKGEIKSSVPVFFHGSVKEITGYTEDELVKGRIKWKHIIHPDDFSSISAGWKSLASKPGFSAEREYRIIRKDKSVKWVHESVQNVSIDGKPAFVEGVITDITERKLLEKQKHEAESKYELIAKNSIDGIGIAQDGKIAYANPAASHIFGYKEGEIAGKEFIKFIAPEDRDFIIRRYKKRISGKNVPQRYMFKGLKKNRSKIDIEASFSEMFDYMGRPALLTILRDVTLRTLSEEALRQSENRYKEEKETAAKYLNLAGSIIVALDSSGRIALMNRRGYEALGYPEGSLEGKSWFDMCIPSRQRREVKEVFAKCMAQKLNLVEHYENRVIAKDGEERAIRWHNIILKDDNGRATGTLSSGEDITDRLVAMHAVNEAKKKYRLIFELCPAAVIVLDSSGNIIEANERVYTWLGYGRHSLNGLSLAKVPFYSEESRKRAAANFKERMKGKEIKPYEVELRTKKGEKKVGIVDATAITDESGAVSGVVCVISDITAFAAPSGKNSSGRK